MQERKIALTRLTVATIRFGLMALAALSCATPAGAADANAGRTFFSQQCSLCHSAAASDNGGAQGPSMIGLYGRRAASNAGCIERKWTARQNPHSGADRGR